MKKKILGFLFVFVCAFFVTVSCSKDKIKNIEIIEDSIKREYIIGEEVIIDEFEVEITFNNNEKQEYTITQNMFTVGEIDNTKVGNQQVNIEVNYNRTIMELEVEITFVLSEDIISVINSIDELPSQNELKFEDENKINLIMTNYENLNDNQKYVSNYDKLLTKKNYLDNKKKELITPEIISQRYVYINSLNKFIASLDQSSYSVSNWNSILDIYQNGVNELNKDDNFSQMYTIITTTKENIMNVKNNNQLLLLETKSDARNSLIEYRNTFDNSLYSSSKFIELELILDEGLTKLSEAINIEDINKYYQDACNKLDAVLTIEEENLISLNNLIANKVYEATNLFLSINLNYYDTDGKLALNSYLNTCINNIKNSTNIENMDRSISILKKQINSVLTIEEKQLLELEEYKASIIVEIQDLYLKIDMYQYDISNRNHIDNLVNESIENINKCLKKEDIDSIKTKLIDDIDDVLTFDEQALLNLKNKVDKYTLEVEEYISKYDSTKYSEENWNVIANIAEELKEYINNITISTLDSEISNYLQEKYVQIENILTIEEENILLLNEAIDKAIDELDDYYNSLDENAYSTSTWELITNKINNVKNKINELDDIDTIDKLVKDTIYAISLA